MGNDENTYSLAAALQETSIIFTVLIGSYMTKKTFALSRVLASSIEVTEIVCLIIL